MFGSGMAAKGVGKAIGGLFKRIRRRRLRKGKKILLPFIGETSLPTPSDTINIAPPRTAAPSGGVSATKVNSDGTPRQSNPLSRLLGGDNPVFSWWGFALLVVAVIAIRDKMTKRKTKRWFFFRK